MAMMIPDDIKNLMYRAWLPTVMTTVLQGVKELPAQHRNDILVKMCKTCEDLAMMGAVGIKPGMSWDEYLKFLEGTAPPIGPWTITQSADVFDLIYDCSIDEGGKPRCHCPLVQLGITEPLPECCSGGADLAERMIGTATGKQVIKAEVISSPLRTGESVCHYRVQIKE
jgi:hypothetical protein